MNLTLTSLQQILKKGVIALQGVAAASLVLSVVLVSNQDAFANPHDQVELIEDIPDNGSSQHPSGNDRNTEQGNSGTQGKSEANPDGNGADKRRDAKDGAQGGTQGLGDYDDNNGCGNDHDFADDNNGNCGGKHKESPSPKPSHTPKPSVSPSPKPSVYPSPKPSPSPYGKKITICHATGSATNPYVEITINYSGLHGHEGHSNDIIPAPTSGCPKPHQSPRPSPSPSPNTGGNPSPTSSPSPSPSVSPNPSPSVSPSPTPSPSPSTNTTTNSGSVLGIKELPATGANVLVYALALGLLPMGFKLAKYTR